MKKRVALIGLGYCYATSHRLEMLTALMEEHQVKIITTSDLESDDSKYSRKTVPILNSMIEANPLIYDMERMKPTKNRVKMYALDSLSKQRKKAKAARKANKQRRKK